jgi:hypothetical protein
MLEDSTGPVAMEFSKQNKFVLVNKEMKQMDG